MLEQERQFKTISVDTFKNIASHKMDLLSRLGLSTVYDLIFNLPFRYEDRTFIQPLSDLEDEQIILNSPCTVLFTIVEEFPDINSKTTTFRAQDISGTAFDITYFSCPDFLQTILVDNAWLLAYGKVSYNQYSERLTMVHPDVHPLNGVYFELPNKLSPIYHLTRGIRQEFMQRLEGKALEILAKHPIDELIPPALNPFQVTLTEALLLTHNPPPLKLHTNMVLEGLSSFRRICFEELVAYKIAILMLHAQQDNKLPQHIPFNQDSHEDFLKNLPFEPTNAQARAFAEIMDDCNKNQPMSRILNGDVGSGKTLVAAMCMLQCASAGKQAVLLAPTEILAQQHHQKLAQLFESSNFEVGLLTGATKRKERTEILQGCKDGSLRLIVGTHAVFQKSVKYQSLALVIVDEQHRFGVGERETLLEKAPVGYAANELLMTATPIPRSLRLALFNETQVSILNEMPKGRLPIVTSLIERSNYNHLVERLQYQCERGEQAFWICPYVDEQENSMVTSVKARHTALKEQLPHLKIGLIHGKMSEKEKNSMMSEFAAGIYHVLVATVIVEVGVDVPNASIIIIEDPQTMGLSQLHQLRGRVGRGVKQSYCILLYRNEQIARQQRPSSKSQQRHSVQTDRAIGLELAQSEPLIINDEFSDDSAHQEPHQVSGAEENPTPTLEVRAKDMMDWSSDPDLTEKLQKILKSHDTISLKRLKILQCTNNGFAIASQDLILRGPGEFFGQNQTGNENFKYADLIRDYRMLGKVNEVAEWIYAHHSNIAEALVMRWYPHFDEIKNQKLQAQQLSKQEQSQIIAEMNSDFTEDDEDNENIFEVTEFNYPPEDATMHGSGDTAVQIDADNTDLVPSALAHVDTPSSGTQDTVQNELSNTDESQSDFPTTEPQIAVASNNETPQLQQDTNERHESADSATTKTEKTAEKSKTRKSSKGKKDAKNSQSKKTSTQDHGKEEEGKQVQVTLIAQGTLRPNTVEQDTDAATTQAQANTKIKTKTYANLGYSGLLLYKVQEQLPLKSRLQLRRWQAKSHGCCEHRERSKARAWIMVKIRQVMAQLH